MGPRALRKHDLGFLVVVLGSLMTVIKRNQHQFIDALVTGHNAKQTYTHPLWMRSYVYTLVDM